jgi:AcrR family transcriptional regulator
MQAALSVFARRGYQAGMGEMANAAGITRTVLYYYFSSKQELFESVYQAQLEKFMEYVAPAIFSPGTLEDRLRETLRRMLRFAELFPDAWDMLYRLTDDTEPEMVEVRKKGHEAFKRAARLMATPEMEDLWFTDAGNAPDIAFDMAVGALAAAVAWWRANPTVPLAEIEEIAYRMFSGHLTPRTPHDSDRQVEQRPSSAV